MRARLALFNALTISGVLVVFIVGSLPMRRLVVERSIDDKLAETAAALARSPDRGVAGLDPLGSPPMFAQATALDGRVLVRSANLGATQLPVGTDDLARARSGQAWLTTFEVDGQRLRAYQTAAFDPPSLLVVATPLVPQPVRRVLLIGLVIEMAVGLCVAIGLGWLLARVALVPVERLAKDVESIASTADLSRRVAVSGDGAIRTEPVTHLAVAFNGMLERLQSATDELNATLEAQQHFVADASHQLRTPLTSMRGNVHLLTRLCAEDCPLTAVESHQEILADLDTESDRMTRLVNDLLWLARADASQHLSLQPIDLEPELRSAYRTARSLSETANVELGAVPAHVRIRADPDRLVQLLVILLDNAIRYSAPNALVSLDANLQARGQQSGVLVEVRDSGPGVPRDERSRIFERFYRSPRAAATEGAGLGLAVARWIAQEHNAELGVIDNLPGGSIFQLWLPTIESD